MKRSTFCFMLLIMAVLISLQAMIAHIARGETIAEERVVTLPQDADKWFISVVGEQSEAHYQQMIAWFKSDVRLSSLRKQVHYRPVSTSNEEFERYRKNVTSLPTIRMQRADGFVVYEASGEEIPTTAGQLYSDISASAEYVQANGVLIDWPILHRPILPYRRNLEQHLRQQQEQCPDETCPAPLPVPPLAPMPPDLSPVGPPEFEGSGPSPIAIIGMVLASLLAGAGGGLINQWKKTYKVE
jgi:hypothetical protein